MAYIIDLKTHKDIRGSLTVVERSLPFNVKRIYFIYDVKKSRGGHRHIKNIQAFICLGGSCEIYLDNGVKEETFILKDPSKCLIVEPKDWHTMNNFQHGSILLVLASEYYDPSDYIKKKY